MANQFTDLSRLWVIFDTCQRPAYYQDVHNLLALPAGAIIRYDYHTRYMSDDAIAAVQEGVASPRDVLLVYVQYKGYARGVGPEYKPAHGESEFAVATRLARMWLTPNIGGQTYAFDLQLEGYPKFDLNVLDAILRPLVSTNQTPWSKWVAISALVNELATLKSGEDADNWAAIVEHLATLPMQFAGDIFWRLGPPVLDGKQTIAPIFETQATKAPGGMRQVSFSYPLREGHRCEFEVFSHVPPTQPGTAGNRTFARELRVGVGQTGPLEFNGSPNIDLRSNSATHIAVRGQRAETVDDRFGLLTLDSGNIVDGWPIGPRLAIQFTVSKSKGMTVLSTVFLIFAVLFGVAAKYVWRDSLPLGVASALATVGCVLIGLVILTRKVGVRL